ncbi:Plant transposase (Ptta/En/Spm family) [Carex littledalei]|uniref:Plant transposase (Ptta/En/Spm family) n=1 Tax=Carex littledalei TaxID=544730 RepID=A0A833RLX8_9POAL|nr:Plant transposase (Ptta/En/Spm family) [Carex littledalei]
MQLRNVIFHHQRKRDEGLELYEMRQRLSKNRPEIWPVGMHEFSCGKDSRQITAAITRLALNYMPSPLRSYNAFDPHTKNNVQKAFLERFRYREGEDADHCREVFDAIAVKRYAEELHTARDKCINKFGWDMPLWKANVPHWCLKAANWHGLCDIFNTEEWQGLRTQNKMNRMSSGFKIAHHGGSASTLQHVDKLISSKSDIANLLFIPSHVETTLKKGTPTLEEIYLHMHYRLENGKSPVLSQYEAATEGVTETTEDGDTNDIVNQPTEETTTPSLAFDINSLQFTNDRAKKVYMGEALSKHSSMGNLDKRWKHVKMQSTNGSGEKTRTTWTISPSSVGFCQLPSQKKYFLLATGLVPNWYREDYRNLAR